MMTSKILLGVALALVISLPAAAQTADSTAGNPGTEARASGDAMHAGGDKGETVDERISNLHQELKITSDEESKWGDVAKVMRDNAGHMEKLVTDEGAGSKSLTAEEELKNYQKLAEAHVDGLKSLRSAFDSLYDSMPDDQKKTADKVFDNFDKSRHSGASQ